MGDFNIRPATMEDMDDVMGMIQELADFEKMPEGPKINAEVLRADSFGSNPSFRCLVAERSKSKGHADLFTNKSKTNDSTLELQTHKQTEHDRTNTKNNSKKADLCGYAIFFYTYSTWEGKAIQLEDLYVKQEYRKQGLGKNMFKRVVEIAKNENCPRVDLHVLNWNPARKIYESLGLKNLTESEGWHFYRLDQAGIKSLS